MVVRSNLFVRIEIPVKNRNIPIIEINNPVNGTEVLETVRAELAPMMAQEFNKLGIGR